MGCITPATSLNASVCERPMPITLGDVAYNGAAIFAPFASIKFTIDGKTFEISVGNKSVAAAENRACITSLQFGYEVDNTGLGAEVELIDHGGLLAEPLSKAITKSAGPTTEVSMNFGWIVRNTSKNKVQKISTSSYDEIKINLFKTEQSLEGSYVKYKLILKTAAHLNKNIVLNQPFGTEEQKISLKEAIIKCLEVINCSARFLDENGKEFETTVDIAGTEVTTTDVPAFKFPVEGSGPQQYDGPLNSWKCSNLTPLDAIRNWLQQITTKDDRGIIFHSDCSDPRVIIFKAVSDYSKKCQNQIPQHFKNPICYVVNGGNCSPVLEFNPSFNWIGNMPPTASAGGISGASMTGQQVMNQDYSPDKDKEFIGPLFTPTVPNDQINWRPPLLAPRKTSEANQVQFDANKISEMYSTGVFIDADLKILGDVRYTNPTNLNGYMITLLVVNPFYVNQCNWITKSECNDVLTSSQWRIQGVSHSISEGTFVTTLKLHLNTPGITVAANQQVSGVDFNVIPTDANKQETLIA